MASLSIPEPLLVGLMKIGTLSNESFRELLSALKNIPLKIRQHRIFEDWPLKLETLPQKDAKAIKDAIIPLYVGRASGQVPVSNYVDDIADALKEARGGVEWIQSEEVLSKFKERLSQLLSIDSLQLIAKAHDVLIEHAHTFSTARIISDIRPVYGDKAEEPPRAAVLVHMLNLTYFSSGERQEFIVALDTKDIHYLMDMLERAKTKTESLKAVIASTNMTYMDVV